MTKYSLVFLLIAATFVFSCKKTVLTGNNLLPKGDNINGSYMDTLTLLTKTVRENRLFTNTSTDYLLGSMRDPVFGNANASIFTQLAPQDYNPSFRGAILDSAVLCLVYSGHYGDLKTVPQSVNVYELTGTMYSDSSYYSDRVFTYNTTKIGSKQNFFPDFNSEPALYSSTNAALDTFSPMLRIRLSNSFGQSLLNADSVNYTTLANSQAYLPGLLIAPDTTLPGKGIMYLNLGDVTGLNLYYHQAGVPYNFSFLLSGGCGKSNLFHHNYINSTAGNALNSKASSDSIVYVQAMAGLRTKITVPYLPSNILINKAEISITQVLNPLTDDTVFHVPSHMYILADSAGTDILTPDFLTSAPLSYGGLASSFVNSMGQRVVTYKFTVTNVLQQMVANLPTYNRLKNYQGLYLIAANSTDVADRIVVGGGNSKAAKMKLTLIYTKLP